MPPDPSIPLPGSARYLSTRSSSRSPVESSPLVLRPPHASLLNLPGSAPSNSASSPILRTAPVFLFSVFGVFSFSSFVFFFSFIRRHSRLFGFIHFRRIKRPSAVLSVNGGACFFAPRNNAPRRARSQIHMQFPRFSVLVMMNLATISVDLDISADIAQSVPPFLCLSFLPVTLFPPSAATLQDFEGLSKERSRTISPYE